MRSILAIIISFSLTISAASSAVNVPALAKAADQPSEKERIGADVPIVSWKDHTVMPWAALLCLHGLTLHANSYAAFGKRMAALGVPTYAIDVRGFGSWQNTKECARVDFDAAAADVKAAVQSIHRANPDIPIILLGESMGGALALHVVADNPSLVDGLICSVPSRKSSGQNTVKMKAAAGIIYAPNREIKVGEKLVHRATSKQVVATVWEQDPLTRMNLTPVELLSYQRMMNQAPAKAEKITNIPVLFLQGINDRLIKPEGTLELFQRLKTPDKNLLMVGAAEHLIFEQSQFDEHLVEVITSWMDKNVLKCSATKTGGTPQDLAEAKSSNGIWADDATRQALGHLKIAQGYLLLNNPEQAKEHLLTILRLAHGNSIGVQADRLLLALPENLIAPKVGPSSPAALVHLTSLESAKANNKPTILIFCAAWIQACQPLMDSVKEALLADAGKVNVVMVDADDPKNESILTEYGIKPLPAILYLTGNNEVQSYTLGSPTISAMRARIKHLLAL
jgi:alpha-beta hydrolase superfamily lysophospholipase/thiol-disulfide isomerase/thioredoxin